MALHKEHVQQDEMVTRVVQEEDKNHDVDTTDTAVNMEMVGQKEEDVDRDSGSEVSVLPLEEGPVDWALQPWVPYYWHEEHQQGEAVADQKVEYSLANRLPVSVCG